MAVAFDVASSGTNAAAWTHTCTGSNLLLIVEVGDFKGADTESVTGITYNGVALTLLGTHAYNTSRCSLWYLIAPATGSHTLAVTSASTVACVASSWTGVDQTSPFGTPVAATGSSSTPTSGSITAATTSWVVANTGNLTDTLTENAGQTNMGNATSGGFHCGASRKAGTGGAMTLGWSNYTSDTRWAVLAVEIKQVTVAAAGTKRLSALGVG